MDFKLYIFLTLWLIISLVCVRSSHSVDNLNKDPKTVAAKTILISYLKESSGDPKALSKEQIEKLESDLKNSYCPERGCEVIQHLKAVGILTLHFKNLKNQKQEVEYLSSTLPEGVVAEADQVVELID